MLAICSHNTTRRSVGEKSEINFLFVVQMATVFAKVYSLWWIAMGWSTVSIACKLRYDTNFRTFFFLLAGAATILYAISEDIKYIRQKVLETVIIGRDATNLPRHKRICSLSFRVVNVESWFSATAHCFPAAGDDEEKTGCSAMTPFVFSICASRNIP